jgi:hypothetical protein
MRGWRLALGRPGKRSTSCSLDLQEGFSCLDMLERLRESESVSRLLGTLSQDTPQSKRVIAEVVRWGDNVVMMGGMNAVN